MQILIYDDEQKTFFSKLMNLQKDVKMKTWGNKKTWRGRRIEDVIFLGKNVEYIKLCNLFNVLENRYEFARYCLEKIHEECEIISDDSSKMNELKSKMKNHQIDAEFVIKCEYFIFAISSCLDTMAHIINIMYNFKIFEYKVSISKLFDKRYLKLRRDGFSRYLLKEWKRWMNEFKETRNKMTHQQIIDFSSQVDHQLQDKKVTFTKNCISIVNMKGDKIIKYLPTYFDEITKDYESLKHEFYKKLNSMI